MCGIAGFLNPARSLNEQEATAAITRMSGTIIHRGPDDGGCFVDASAGVALTNRRLAVVDLSPQGHQPMTSQSGRYVIVFNGEIYNHAELRASLTADGGPDHYRGHSDTETLLEGAAHWGLADTLRRSVGMFAIALWDRETRTLSLARDRIGEKPLYYGWNNGSLLFGSELKALRAYPHWRGEIDREAEALYFQFGYVPAPRSIYEGISKLAPGSIVAFTPESKCAGAATQYWDVAAVIQPAPNRSLRTDQDAVTQLDALLTTAISRQMLADVPVGTFLSGGVDSSAVTAIAQANSSRPIQTFTIGFEDRVYDESQHAAAVAKHLGTDHTCLMVSPADAQGVIPKLPAMYDEPFSDSSQIPTYLVSCVARQKVTVALSGDGGDEMFGGYNRHYWVGHFWGQIGWAPQVVRSLASDALLMVSPQQWQKLLGALARVKPSLVNHRNPGDKIHKLASIIGASDAIDMNDRVVTGRWPRQNENERLVQRPLFIESVDMSEQIMLLDMLTYLPDDIMVKVDRAAMAISLETRAPFLDHTIVEFAWSLNPAQKIRGKTGKWILRQVLDKYVPRELIERPKMGFGIPVGNWLRGPLREWAESLLTPEKLARQHAIDPALIRQRWNEHLSGARNWTEALWSILMYEAWLDESA